MNKKKKERYLWEKYFRIDNPDGLPIYVKHVNLRCTEIGDDGIALMVRRIRSIELLDLDETSITNEAIRHLPALEGLKELRLKGNYPVDNDCLDHLSLITTLELLHLGGTSVNFEQVGKLASLKNLKTLLLSSSQEEDASEKLFALAVALPDCRFIVNYKEVRF